MIHELLSIGLAGATASEGGAESVNRTDRVAADRGYGAAGTFPDMRLCQANIGRQFSRCPRFAVYSGADDTHYHVAPVTTPSLDPTGPP